MANYTKDDFNLALSEGLKKQTELFMKIVEDYAKFTSAQIAETRTIMEKSVMSTMAENAIHDDSYNQARVISAGMGGDGIRNIRWNTTLGKLQFTFKAGDTVNEDEWIDVHEGYAVLVEVSCPPV